MDHDKWNFPEIYFKGKFKQPATYKQLEFIEGLADESSYLLSDILASIPNWTGDSDNIRDIRSLQITKGQASFIISVYKGHIKPVSTVTLSKTERTKVLDEARRIMLGGNKPNKLAGRNVPLPIDDE